MKPRLSSFLVSILVLLLAVPALGEVGELVLARNDVRGTPAGGATKALAVGEALSVGLRVETGADSAAKMTFDPKGSLTLGSRAKVTLDSARVDQVTGRSESALSVLGGAVRLALGRLFQGEVAIDTPTAVVGVKGTDLRVEVDETTGSTVVTVTEGIVTVRSKAGGEVTVRAGQRTVVVQGRAPELPRPIVPGSGTLSASAGGPAFTLPQASFPETPLVGVGGQVIVRPPPTPNGMGFVP